MIIKILKNILLILLGPALTFLLYFINERPPETSGYIAFAKIILIMGMATIIVSCLGHIIIKNFQKSMVVNIIVSEIVYVLGLIYIFLRDGTTFADYLMWLPVAVIFLILFSLPMGFLIAFGVGNILKDIRNIMSLKSKL